MKYTINYNLKKPDLVDTFNINDFNQSSDLIDTNLKRIDSLISELTTEVDNNKTEVTSQMAEIMQVKGCTNTLKKLNNKNTVKIVCVGDSITYGYVGGAQSANPYPKVLQDKLRKVYGYSGIDVINSGVAGETTTGILTYFNSSVIDYHPDCVVIMFGLNDSQSVTLTQYEDNLNQMVKTCIDNGIEIILCSPTQAFLGSYRNDIKAYSEKCKKVAELNNTSFIDMFEEFRLLNESNYIPLNIAGDDTHLKTTDYYILADIVLSNILVPFTINNLKNDLIIPSLSNNVFTVGTDKYKDVQILTGGLFNLKSANANDTIKLAIYVRKNGKYRLNLLHCSNGYGTVSVEKEGTVIKTVSGTKATGVYNDETYLCDLTLGFNLIELKASSVTGGTGGGSGAFAVTGFLINENIQNDVINQNIGASNNQTVEVLKNLFDLISSKSPSAVLVDTAKFSYLSDKVFSLIDNKTLIMEFNMKTDGYGGFGWFGTKTYLGTTYNMGYWLRMYNDRIDLWNNSTKLGEYLASFTFGNYYKIRIEHTSAGQIKVYVDDVLRITATNTGLNSGCLFFSQGQGVTYITLKDVNMGYI